MASLKEIRNRITSVHSTTQITSAMRMVSSSKLKRAQDAIQKLRPYSNKMQELLANVSSTLEGEEIGGEYIRKNEVKKVLLVVMTSNRGLAGSFNSSVIKAVKKLINTRYKNIQVDLLTVGKKGHDILSKEVENCENHSELWNSLTYENATQITDTAIEYFISGKYDKVELVYNHFKNIIIQQLKVEPFLPIELNSNKGDQVTTTTDSLRIDYLFEPSKKEILTQLIPKALRTQFFKAILDSNAAEHGARTTAMQSATDNANALKQDLIITYNKARQAAITNELIEIVSGAKSLEN